MKTNLVYGGKCTELLANYDQELHCWKMLQMSFGWADPMLLDRLPKSGMTVNGQLYELQISERHTIEPVGFVLPTPTATEHKYRLKGNSQASKNLEALARTGQLTPITGKGSQLNPQFVEEMMGFPIGWTELQP